MDNERTRHEEESEFWRDYYDSLLDDGYQANSNRKTVIKLIVVILTTIVGIGIYHALI